MSFVQRLRNFFSHKPDTEPRQAYDLWAAGYDDQPGNLMLDMDETLFAALLNNVSLGGKVVADIGCGTGRHWNKLQSAARLIGYDVSEGMLGKLKEKFPEAEVYRLDGYLLNELSDGSCDLVLSTLALAHMPDSLSVLKEWHRVLKPGGDLLLTDYHPQALQEGGKRTFEHEGQLIAVKNHIHPTTQVRTEARQLGLQEIRFTERVIDDSVREYYVKHQALPLFERFRGVPMIYGIHFKKIG